MRPVSYGFTPGKGSKFKKGDDVEEDEKGLKQKAHEIRCANCVGIPSGIRLKENCEHHSCKCELCGINTPYYCFGCKRHLCYHKDQSGKLGEEHDPQLNRYETKVSVYDKDQKRYVGMSYFMLRSCHQIAHEEAWQRFLEEPNSVPLSDAEKFFLGRSGGL